MSADCTAVRIASEFSVPAWYCVWKAMYRVIRSRVAPVASANDCSNSVPALARTELTGAPSSRVAASCAEIASSTTHTLITASAWVLRSAIPFVGWPMPSASCTTLLLRSWSRSSWVSTVSSTVATALGWSAAPHDDSAIAPRAMPTARTVRRITAATLLSGERSGPASRGNQLAQEADEVLGRAGPALDRDDELLEVVLDERFAVEPAQAHLLAGLQLDRRQARLVRLDLQVAQAEAVALGAQRADVEQRLRRVRDGAIPVLPLDADVVDLGRCRDVGQPPVRLQAQLLLLDVVLRQERIGRHVELDLARLLHRLALHLPDGLGDHLAVEVVADRGDVPALRLAEQVAGAADLQVAHRDLEPRTEVGGLADRLQPLVGLLGQPGLGRVEQVGVGPAAAAADAAAQLVHLAEAEQVGPLDDERVHGRHVDAALDDRGAHEDVVAAFPEVDDDLLERALVHLPVGDGDARLGDQLAQARGGHVDRLHPVVHPEHLPLTEQFPADRLDGDALVVAADVGEDRLAIGRRGLQQRQVADADEAHLQGARDRRGGQGDHVHVDLQLLHRLLGLDAEALLLVDDEEAEVLELDAVLQQTVGADDAIDLARFEAGEHLAGLLGGEEAAEHLDADRVAGEAVGEGVAVLGGQQRGRGEHRDLLAVLDRLERRPDGRRGLAEADVAAHQAVHRVGPLHVDLDVVDRLALVGGLDEREGVLHLVLPGRVHGERMPGRVDPLLVEQDELLGDLPHGAADLVLGLGEVGAAEAVQRRRLAADVLAQGVDLVAGDVQLVAALVRQEEVVALDPADGPLGHALVPADAVLVVDDVRTGLEVLEDGRALALARPGATVGAAPAGEVRLGDHGQLGRRDRAAAVQRSDGDRPAGPGQVGGRIDQPEVEAALQQ